MQRFEAKQKLGVAATLAWNRSGGSIKIFLDTGGLLGTLSLFLLPSPHLPLSLPASLPS